MEKGKKYSDQFGSSEKGTPRDIYDRMFKAGISLSKKSVILFINGLFGTDYPVDSEVTYNWTEFVGKKDLGKVLADTIITINQMDGYHMEVQLKGENVILRMLEYGFRQSLRGVKEVKNPETGEEEYAIQYPRQMIIYLDKADKIPDEYPVRISFQGEGSYTYKIPVLHFQEKSISEIQKEHLYILLPFKLLSMRHEMEKAENRTEERINQLIHIYRDDILSIISQAYESGDLEVDDWFALKNMTHRLTEHLYRKYADIWKEVGPVHDESLELECNKYIREMEKLREEYKEVREAVSENKKELEESKKELDESKKELAENKKELAENKKELAEKEETVKRLADENRRLKEQLEALKGSKN